MKILITGGDGFLARHMIVPLAEQGHTLRLMDVRPFDSPHEVYLGDVTNLTQVREAIEGVDSLVLAHMAPRNPDSYCTPEVGFDINVKGTANLLFQAVQAGLRRVVLISSVETVRRHPGPPWRCNQPACAQGIYGLTKLCAEVVAEHYASEHDLAVASLRVGYLVEPDTMVDKYGNRVSERAALDTDPYDVGEVTRLFLESNLTGYHLLPVMSTHEALATWDLQFTCDQLHWKPRFAFDRLPLPSEAP
jgi:nucleoside-diphosphate-sugar epimerase